MKRTLMVTASAVAIAAVGWMATASYGGLRSADDLVAADYGFELPDVITVASPGGADGAAAGPAAEVDTSYLWAAFEAGDYQSVREELVVLQRLNPNWTPPADLVGLTDAMQSRRVVLPAVEQGAFAEAVSYYEAHRPRFACADVTIEALWAVAEAYAALDDPDAAFGVYQRVLDECEVTDLRLATLEKAIALQDPDRFRGLIAIEDERGHDQAELERLARIRKDALGGGGPTGPVQLSRLDRTLKAVGARRASSEDLAWLADNTRETRNANAAMVLGYHALDAGEAETAVQWFGQSLEWRRTAKAAEGLFHAYGRLGREDEQRRLASRYPQTLGRLATSAGDAPLAKAWQALEAGDAERAMLYADVAPGTTTSERELVRGWALLQADRPGEAEAAFTAAAAGGSSPDRTSAEKGRALALIAAGRAGEVEVDEAMPAEDAADIELAKLDREIVAVFEGGDPEGAHALVQERARRFPDAPSLGTLEGWILYEMGELYAADRFFAELWVSSRNKEARTALLTVREAMYASYR